MFYATIQIWGVPLIKKVKPYMRDIGKVTKRKLVQINSAWLHESQLISTTGVWW